ncbi:DUF4376 domain-containing protein [Yoonia vestfoldensis]|uniref:DUF4376 domain-containing protein n=1 Tax=Yoonia vestfoldensis TaxID=245188 RepID=A0A1Y0EHA1_9RHOB|nr:DUF4376 domain-containing protein [Yoonia vestfoldensis]ARU02964.1 hypothetical protein LOKVESSMR4R_03698 [Yoonia vestfoldensis]
MPFAANGQISTTDFDGAVEISQAQYNAALEGMMNGKVVVVDGGFAVVDPPEPEPKPEPEPLTPEEELAAIHAEINAERDRRLRADFAFAGKMFQRDAVSLARITGAATLAGFAMAQGAGAGDLRWANPDRDFMWIAADNSLMPMDAPTAFDFGAAAAQVETEIVFAARALREMDPVPDDIADDQWWP